MQVLTASGLELIPVFTGLSVRQFRKLVIAVRRHGGPQVADGRPGRQWRLDLANRVLLVAVYYRTNLTMRQLAPLFGISPASAHRVIDRLGPHLALAPARRPGTAKVLIVDGTLVPTHDRQVAASSKNYRYSTNLQVLIDADTRLVLAVGDLQPGNRNDCTAYAASGVEQTTGTATVIADGGYRGTGLLIPHRRQPCQAKLPAWQEEHNASHRQVRARVEHVFARMKNWKILRDCRRRGNGVHTAALGIAHLHNLAWAS